MIRVRIIVALAVLGPLLWLFGPVLFSSRSFVFRDAAHYYYPLFQWTSAEWAAGRVPLWNPQESCGLPVLADTTSSVFYPGKLIFAVPGLAYATEFKLYIVAHLLLAAANAYWLARRFRASVLASGACALSYALGGNVVFQYCNVVFLVGAAWLPLALLATDRMVARRSIRAAVALGAVLALATLGGDPQTAYHAGLLAVLYALLVWRAERRARRHDKRISQPIVAAPVWRRMVRHRLTLLAAAAASGAVLAAVQILPAIEWSRQSDRSTFEVPRNVYEIPEYLQRKSPGPGVGSHAAGVADGLLGQPRGGTHHDFIYQFSVGPWRLAELIWPNCYGRLFPTNRRWITVLPAEERTWTPSLYMGLLPLLLALSVWRLRGGDVRVRWLSWLVLLGGAGALGWYGLGWLIQEFRYSLFGADPADVRLGPPVGGLYWLLVVALPGYAFFRFPAKLFLIASLGLSLLAARGWDRQFLRRRRWLLVTTTALGIASLLASGVFLLVRRLWWDGMLADVPADDICGPLDTAGAARDVCGAFLHTGLLSLALAALWWWREPLHKIHRRLVPCVALLLTAIEITVAHGWLIAAAPTAVWNEPSSLAKRIEEADEHFDGGQPYRVFRGSIDHWAPPAWRESSSPDRQVTALRWDHDTLFPKYQLQTEIAYVESYGTMASRDYVAFLNVARQHGPVRPDGISEPQQDVLDALATKYLLLPGGFNYPGVVRVEQDALPESRQINDATVWYNPYRLPRAWIVHDVEWRPPFDNRDPAALESQTRAILFPDNESLDFRNTAVVETDLPHSEAILRAAAPETCRIVVDDPQRVEIDVELSAPGLLVLSDLYYPGWTTQLYDEKGSPPERVTIYRVNRVMRGVAIPTAGHCRVVLCYRPTSFYAGALVSVLGWLSLAAVGWHAQRAGSSSHRASGPFG